MVPDGVSPSKASFQFGTAPGFGAASQQPAWRYTWDDIQDLYELPDGPARNLQAHDNVAPTDPVEVVRPAANGTAELISMRWGLIPWWWKKPLKQLPASFNARAESVADKPMFRVAFRHRGLRRSKDDVHRPAPLVPRRIR